MYSEGKRVAVLLPQTYMNESGNSAGPARGALGVDLDHVVAVHDEIDLPFGRVEVRTGGGLAGHNGLKSLKRGLGSGDFRRVRVGVGRPDSTDPEIVSRYVLGRFSEDESEVRELVERAADELERLVSASSLTVFFLTVTFPAASVALSRSTSRADRTGPSARLPLRVNLATSLSEPALVMARFPLVATFLPR